MAITIGDFGRGLRDTLLGFGAGSVSGGRLGGLVGGIYGATAAARGRPLAETAAIAGAGGLVFRPALKEAQRESGELPSLRSQAFAFGSELKQLPGRISSGGSKALDLLSRTEGVVSRSLGALGNALFSTDAFKGVFREVGARSRDAVAQVAEAAPGLGSVIFGPQAPPILYSQESPGAGPLPAPGEEPVIVQAGEARTSELLPVVLVGGAAIALVALSKGGGKLAPAGAAA